MTSILHKVWLDFTLIPDDPINIDGETTIFFIIFRVILVENANFQTNILFISHLVHIVD